MAAPFKDFDAAVREVNGDRPTFKLGGQTFTCKARLKGTTVIQLLNLVGTAQNQETAALELMANIDNLFAKVLIKPDRERFFEVIRGSDEDEDEDDEAIIDFTSLMELMSWLMNMYLGNLGGSASNSDVGPSEIGQPAKVISLDPASGSVQ